MMRVVSIIEEVEEKLYSCMYCGKVQEYLMCDDCENEAEQHEKDMWALGYNSCEYCNTLYKPTHESQLYCSRCEDRVY